MSEQLPWDPLRLDYRPQPGGEIRCQNAFGLVFYLRPINPIPSPLPERPFPPSPRAAQAWVQHPPRQEPQGLLRQLVARVKPARQGESA